MRGQVLLAFTGFVVLAGGGLLGRAPAVAQTVAAPRTPAADATLRTLFEEIRPLLRADNVLGESREVRNVTIIPIATVGFGLGAGAGGGRGPRFEGETAPGGSGGAGGGGAGVIPEAVLVVSDEGVELLPVQRGVLTGVAEALAPVILEGIRGRLRGMPAEEEGTESTDD